MLPVFFGGSTMLSHRAYCIGLLLLPVLPAFGQKAAKSHGRAPADSQVRAVILPASGLATDSVQTIITRDLGFGDRVQILLPSETQSATVVVKTIGTAQGLTVSLVDPVTGAVKQQEDFPLPIVMARHDQAIADSLNGEFVLRYNARNTRMAHASAVRDSLQAAAAMKAPKLRNKEEKARYDTLVAHRNSALAGVMAEIATIQSEGDSDQAGRAAIQEAAIAHDVATRDSVMHVRRWALHGVSDAIEEWMTGHRGIAQSRVAYVSNGVIRVVDFDGANDHAVTSPEKAGDKAMSPSWNSDGTALVYSEMSDAGTQIALVDLITGKSRQIAGTPRGLNITPVFSADDKWVIYANGSDARTSLVTVRTDSVTSLKYLPLNRLFDVDEPILSPDGSRIAYVSSRPKTPQIYSSKLDGTDEIVEAPAPPKTRIYHTSPDWSPDGSMIAYQQQNGDFQVWVVNRSNHRARKLTTTGENEDPSWAPDARHIALTSTRGGAKAIWILDVESGNFRQLTSAGDARLAAWSGPLGSSAPTPLAVAR
jgi:TolB protein